MWTVKHAVGPPPGGLDLPNHARVDVLYRFRGHHSTMDGRLVGDHDDGHIQASQLRHRLQYTGQELELFPTLHMVTPIPTNDAIAVYEHSSMHFTPL